MNHNSLWIGAACLAALGPFWGESYVSHVLILCFIWCIVVIGWDLILGYAGIFNFAQLAFFAAGAYTTGMLSINLGLDPVVSTICAGAIVGGIGFLVGLPTLRLRGEYVALFTFAVHLALPSLITQGRSLGTGGSTGLMGIPPFEAFGYTLSVVDKIGWYYLSLVVAVAIAYLVYFVILPGRLGRAFVALRDSEDFARSVGVNDYHFKLIAFSLSGMITGIAGALYAHYLGVVTPKILGNEFFLMVMLMISVGGIGRFPGVILGAFIITIGNELLRDTGQYRLLILGTCVIFSILFLPNGILQLRERLAEVFRRG